MFTGIIEEKGIVKEINRGSKSVKLRIAATKVLQDVKAGDSISTNGICLTVVHFGQNSFTAEVMAETLRKTNLSSLSVGSSVNLERALKLNDRLGGHLVSGHIDGTGIIDNIQKEEIAQIISIRTTASLLRYIVNKGSVAIDGISLTVFETDETLFKVSIIPHTATQTTLLSKKIGDSVNIETDMIAKYAEKLLMNNTNAGQENSKKNEIDMNFLHKNGFI